MSVQKVMVQFHREVKWDNWGRLVTVFRKNDVVVATLHESGNYSAETPYWPGVRDLISPEDFTILANEEDFRNGPSSAD